jgi:ABC-type nitrate/sulfonate/bicarbonate transport system substrate-binding protein
MPYFNVGIAVSKDYLTNNRETVKKFVAALEEARQLFKDNKEIAFRAISGQDKITDTAILEQVWAFYNQYWANPGTVSADALMRAVQESSAEATRQGGEALVSSMYDNSVVEDVIAGN